MALLMGVLTVLPAMALAMPSTNNPHVDTFGGGAATVLVTGNKLDGPSHLEDWYNGNHYTCFRQADLSASQIQNKLNHGWTSIPWGNPYVSDHGLITIRGPYLCHLNAIGQ